MMHSKAICLHTSPVRQGQAHIPVWTFVPAYLLLHLLVATCLPEKFDPVSTLFIVLAELVAIVACFRGFRTAGTARAFWLLLIGAIAIHAMAMGVEAVTEITKTPILNHAGRIQILLSMLSAVPILAAVSLQNDERILPISRIIHGTLSLTIGAVIYFEIFSFLSVHGAANPSDAVFLTYLFDAMDVFLAIAGTIRWLGSIRDQERAFFRVLAIFLWANAIFPAIHNRVLIHRDYVWLDLLISTPYILLVPLLTAPRDRAVAAPNPAFVRIVRSGSSLFLACVLVIAGFVAARSNLYVGVACAFVAVAGYGTLNILTLSRGIKIEESLLASKVELEKLVEIDSLTGIANRRAFDEVFLREFALTQRTQRPLSVLMIDVDYFKGLNDVSGHLVGDEYLTKIARALHLNLTRSTDFVARYGGEEFSATLPATNGAGAMVAAEKLRKGVAALGLGHANSPSGIVTVSIGVSTFDGSILCSPAELLQTADEALYSAKRAGRNRCEFLASRSSTPSVIPFASGQ